MRLLGVALFLNDLAPTAVFIWLYHRYQPGRHGWRGSETGQQMMAMAGVLAGLLLLSIVATLAPMVGWVRALVVVLAAGGHLLLAGVLWWRVRLLVRAQRRSENRKRS